MSKHDHLKKFDSSDGLSHLSKVQPKLKPSVQPKLKPSIQPKLSTSNHTLPEDVQTKMEGSFGEDFSDINIHKDSGNAEELGAKAYVQGKDIHFAPGEFQPNTKSGQELIGHELTHVVQQKEGKVNGTDLNGKDIVNSDPALEKEADTLGAKAAAGESLQLATNNYSTPKIAGPIQRVVTNVLNYDKIAQTIKSAVKGWGTDEDAIYGALARLNKSEAAIAELKRVYQLKYKTTLLSDLHGDLSGGDLRLALSFLTPNAPLQDKTPAINYNQIARTIHNAVDGVGTDENAVYGALSKLGKIPGRIKELKRVYQELYGSSLKSDLRCDFSGDQLRLVLELIGETTTISNEKVNISNNTEYKESQRIIKRIWVNYNIDVNSQAGVEANRKDYQEVPKETRDKLKTKHWEYKELVALEKALAHFAPILGANRETSNRKGASQEIRSVSKVAKGINPMLEVVDDSTAGEFFESSKNFTMFGSGTNSTGDFTDNKKQLEGTAIHEIAHGLCKYALPDYIKEMTYWFDEESPSGIDGAEAPITKYGATNAWEDMAEAVMYYFMDPDVLKNGKGQAAGTPGNPCPLRHAFIKKMVQNWKK